jgi:RNA polymerase primary sigma factor
MDPYHTEHAIPMDMLIRHPPLEVIRKQLRLTQLEVARLAGIPVAKLSDYENHKAYPSTHEMQRLSQVLGKPPEYLFPESLLKLAKRNATRRAYRTRRIPEAYTDWLAQYLQLKSDPEERLSRQELEVAVYRALSRLGSKEAAIVKLRWGLLDGQQHTLKQVGTIYGVKGQYVHQLEQHALEHLRRSPEARTLRYFLH